MKSGFDYISQGRRIKNYDDGSTVRPGALLRTGRGDVGGVPRRNRRSVI